VRPSRPKRYRTGDHHRPGTFPATHGHAELTAGIRSGSLTTLLHVRTDEVLGVLLQDVVDLVQDGVDIFA
jgi:hypothetical protein